MAGTARPAPLAEPPPGASPVAPRPFDLPAVTAEASAIDTTEPFAPSSTPTTAPPQASLAKFTLARQPPSPPPRTEARVPMERAAASAPPKVLRPSNGPQVGRAIPAAPKGQRVIVTKAFSASPAAQAAAAATAPSAALAPPGQAPALAPAALSEELPPVLLPSPASGAAPAAPAAPGLQAPTLPPAPLVAPDTLEAVSSIEFGTRPEPGIQAQSYLWRDLLDGEAPARAKYGEGGYAVYHAIDVDESVRITYQTLVGVRSRRKKAEVAHDDHRIVADSRVTVQKRALLEVMDEVRQFADQRAARQREALARKLARRRSAALHRNRFSRRLAFARIKARAHLSNGLIRTQRRVLRGLVEVPDTIISGALRVESHLSTRLGRQGLAEGLKDSKELTQDQRSVLLFLTALTLLAGVLILNSVFALASPDNALVYRRMLADAALQIVGLFGAPIIIEPLFIFSIIAMGPALAFTGFFAGKMIGAWVLYLLGDSLRHHLEKKNKAKGGEKGKMMAWMERNSRKYGFIILVADNALPLAPDQLMLVLAVMGIRLRTWMWGIAIGTAIKFGLMIAFYVYFGHEFVEGFFSRPWEYI